MGLADFLPALFADGRVRVAADEPSSNDMEQVDAQLLEFELGRRSDLPATPPEFSVEAARHGALMLYRACQFLVFRDAEPDAIQREISREYRGQLSASVHYSVDLTLRYLPDTVCLARGKSEDDPLIVELCGLAERWPLSSVGIAGVEAENIDVIVADACLLGLYVDRIIARLDLGRLQNELVRDAALCAIGLFPELAPEVAVFLGVDGNMRKPVEETE